MRTAAASPLTVSVLIFLAALTAASPVSAQPCRDNLGGEYVYPHVGIKPDGLFFSAIAVFNIRPASGTFDVRAAINGRGTGVFSADTGDRPFAWVDGCMLYLDRPGFVGIVSDDGTMISLVTFDHEQMAGVAIRQRRSP